MSLDTTARRFTSFPHWLLEARRFASYPHWLLKRDVSLLTLIGCWKRNVSLLSPKQQYIYCGRGSETFRFLPPLNGGSETFRFFHPNSNIYIVDVEARRFASFLHWLLDAKRFASFTQTAIYILWAWKRDVSLPPAISSGS